MAPYMDRLTTASAGLGSPKNASLMCFASFVEVSTTTVGKEYLPESLSACVGTEIVLEFS